MLQTPETTSDISLNNLVGIIFGKEHSGWVSGLSYGACASLIFKKSTTRLSGMNYDSSSALHQMLRTRWSKWKLSLQLWRI